MRSPNWHECEVMLALDLYLNKDLKWINRMSDSTFEIIALSKILNALDFYSEKPDNFRSTGSIRMKLANFMALDEHYDKNSLDNVGALDKSTWKKYSKQKEELHRACVTVISEHLVNKDDDIDKYLQMFGLYANNNYDKNFSNYVRQMKRTLAYYEKLAEANPNVSYSKEVIECCRKIQESITWVEKVECEIDYTAVVEYKEHAGVNLVPIKKRKIKSNNEIGDNAEKIGKLVQRTITDLIIQDKLSDEMIENLMDPKYSQDNFGLKLPFLCLIDESKNVRDQLIDENGYVRYWTKPFEIKGVKYCVSKEWFENQRNRYLRWLSSIDIKPFCMVKAKLFEEILMYIKKLDSKNVCISKKELITNFSDKAEIEEIISILIDKGVLSGFQGSTKELVIDDYDAFFKMLNNPKNYALE